MYHSVETQGLVQKILITTMDLNLDHMIELKSNGAHLNKVQQSLSPDTVEYAAMTQQIAQNNANCIEQTMDTAGPMIRRVLNVIGHAQQNAGPARSDLSVHMAETSSGAATTARLKAMSRSHIDYDGVPPANVHWIRVDPPTAT